MRADYTRFAPRRWGRIRAKLVQLRPIIELAPRGSSIQTIYLDVKPKNVVEMLGTEFTITGE